QLRIIHHDIGEVLGSGWAHTIESVGQINSMLAFAEVPDLGSACVAGHVQDVTSVKLPDGRNVVVLGSVRHYSARRDSQAAAHVVRTFAASAATIVVLTNGSGGLSADFIPGTPVLISDHINLTGTTPLVGPEFVDMTDAYSRRLRTIAKRVDPSLAEGVYVQFAG